MTTTFAARPSARLLSQAQPPAGQFNLCAGRRGRGGAPAARRALLIVGRACRIRQEIEFELGRPATLRFQFCSLPHFYFWLALKLRVRLAREPNLVGASTEWSLRVKLRRRSRRLDVPNLPHTQSSQQTRLNRIWIGQLRSTFHSFSSARARSPFSKRPHLAGPKGNK